jgi:cell wall assembly regulator SMI1
MSGMGNGWDAVVRVWREALVRAGREEAIPAPATMEAARRAETRLGVRLPSVLLDLYSVADGLPTLGGDVYGVRGCAELMWFREAEAELVAIWDEINRDGGYLTDDLALMRKGLAVSKDGDEYRLLLVPTERINIANPGDWRLYRHSNGGSGVTVCESLVETLLDIVGLYFDVHP